MTKSYKIAIAAGGTAGHINPALALAEELRVRGHEVTFFGQETKLEGRLVPEAGFDLFKLSVSGFDRARPWTGVTALVKEAQAKKHIKASFAESGAPDVAIGFGAYVESSLLAACRSMGVPTMIHEQNSVPGLANKIAAPKAAEVCVAIPAAVPVFENLTKGKAPIVLTGNPVRKAVLAGSGERFRASQAIPADATMLLVFGGSLGARHINEALAALRDKLLAIENLYIVQSTGGDLYDETCELLNLTPEQEQRWHVQPYINDMGDALAAADCVVSRSGASSIAEIAALCVPSVLIPYPLATADHQTTNAKSLVDAGAARLVSDDSLGDGALEQALMPLLSDISVRDAMREVARELGMSGAAERLADEVEKVASK